MFFFRIADTIYGIFVFFYNHKRITAALMTALVLTPLFSYINAEPQKSLPQKMITEIYSEREFTEAVSATANGNNEQLRRGSRGADVKRLQKRLMELGYLEADSATGYFGQQTEDALMEFQETSGLICDGICGKKTAALIYSMDAPQYK